MKYMLVCGGSGGHIYPALALAQKIRDDVVFLTSDRDIDESIFSQVKFKRETIAHNPFPGISFQIILFLWRLILGSFKVGVLIFKHKPEIIIGFGGAVTVLPIIMGRLFNIKTIVYELNVMPGRANRFLFPMCHKIIIMFEETLKYISRYKEKTDLCLPVMRNDNNGIDSEELKNNLNIPATNFVILIIGGSQGSTEINNFFYKLYSENIGDIFDNISIVHITGSRTTDINPPKNITLVDYAHNIADYYKIADLVISRAGAMTIAELIEFELPSILIPYPFAGRHQFYNAEILIKNGSASTISLEFFEKGARDFYAAVKRCQNKDIYQDMIFKIKKYHQSRLRDHRSFFDYLEGYHVS